MKNVVLALILASSLSGCTLWDAALGVLKPSEGISVDAEMTIGDKTEEVNTEIAAEKNTTHNVADQVYNTYQEMNEAAPWWIILLLILGWVLPAPHSMWNGIVRLFKRK